MRLLWLYEPDLVILFISHDSQYYSHKLKLNTVGIEHDPAFKWWLSLLFCCLWGETYDATVAVTFLICCGRSTNWYFLEGGRERGREIWYPSHYITSINNLKTEKKHINQSYTWFAHASLTYFCCLYVIPMQFANKFSFSFIDHYVQVIIVVRYHHVVDPCIKWWKSLTFFWLTLFLSQIQDPHWKD